MDREIIINLGIYSIFFIFITLCGGIIPLIKKWNESQLRLFIGFSAGTLLGASFLHIIPTAINIIGERTSSFTLIGFLFIYIFEKFIMIHSCDTFDCNFHTIGLSAFLGLSIHGLTDGIAMGSSMMIPLLGSVVFLSLIAHKAPAAFSLTTILKKGNYSNIKIIIMNLIFALLMPIGALLTFTIFKGKEINIGAALSFSAGTFLYISISDLLPEVHRLSKDRYKIFLSFLIGLSIMVILTTIEK
jgi:zinc and cadmium transporter